MALKNLIKNKKNILYIIIFSVIVIACLWAFISAGMITKSFKTKIIDQTYKNKEANIESVLVTETKDGQKLWELYADTGMYTDIDNIVLLENLLGNFYDEKNEVKASFKADKGTYNATSKQIILYDNVVLVYYDGTNINAERIIYSGKDKDILAQGNVRIEKPNEAVVIGNNAILKGDYSDFHIEGRTKTQFYM
ncbi:MAG: LPS export ABC transporter periplasmic protein LptC [Candidatus Gastranaerophilales bacterium]|nr:LPS export ABC transporter periplasmic protein LptC [Candidatus Gastranaerophilales bacterium]